MSSRIRMQDIKYFFLEEQRQFRIFIDTSHLEGTEHEQAQQIARAVKEQVGFIKTESLMEEAMLELVDEYVVEVLFEQEPSRETEALLKGIADSVRKEHIALEISVG